MKHTYNYSKNKRCVDCDIPVSNHCQRCRDCSSKQHKQRMKGNNNPMFGSHRTGKKNPFYGKHHTKKARKSMSKKHKGKKLSAEHCAKIKAYVTLHPSFKGHKATKKVRKLLSQLAKKRTGKKNPNYKHGQCRVPYPPKFRLIKKLIKERDGYKCQLCGLSQTQNKELYKHDLAVHHIDYNKNSCSKNNLITLCSKCHSKTNGIRDYWYAYLKELMQLIFIAQRSQMNDNEVTVLQL